MMLLLLLRLILGLCLQQAEWLLRRHGNYTRQARLLSTLKNGNLGEISEQIEAA